MPISMKRTLYPEGRSFLTLADAVAVVAQFASLPPR
jgi:hypothetical protein